MNLCGLCEHELHGDQAGRYLCARCRSATDEQLAELPRLYKALDAFLAPVAPRGGPVVTVVREPPMPVSEPVLNLRGPGGMLGILEDWRAALHAELGWTEPTQSGSYEDRIFRAAGGLRLNLLWIASSWPMAGPLAEEIRDLHRGAAVIVAPPEKFRRLGYCIAVHDDGAICNAVLRHKDGQTTVRCARCGCSYGPNDWLTLATLQPSEEAV